MVQPRNMNRGNGRRRNYPTTTGGSRPEFFKVFFHDLTSEQLRIPPAFVRKFSGLLHEKAKLKDHCGSIWNVDIEKTDDEIFMKNGWPAFVDHHSLKLGEFIVFRYVGNSIFTVKIFRTDGCKEEAFVPKKIDTDVKTEESDEEMEAEVTCFRPSSNSQRRMKSSGKQEVKQRTLPRTHSQAVQAKNVCGLEEFSQNPSFVHSLALSNNNYVFIKKSFLTMHNIKLGSKGVICNDRGEQWPVNIYRDKHGRSIIGKGWKPFQKENGMCPGEQCKLIFDKRRSNLIKVQRL